MFKFPEAAIGRGVPKRFGDATNPDGLDILQAPTPEYTAALDHIREIGDLLRAGKRRAVGSTLLIGPHGSGKTTAACWLFGRAIEGLKYPDEEGDMLWRRANQVLGYFDRSWDKAEREEQEYQLHHIRNCKFLVLDDLLRINPQREVGPQLIDHLIEDRYDNLKATIITTSAKRDEVVRLYGERFADILAGWRTISMFLPNNMRLEAPTK